MLGFLSALFISCVSIIIASVMLFTPINKLVSESAFFKSAVSESTFSEPVVSES